MCFFYLPRLLLLHAMVMETIIGVFPYFVDILIYLSHLARLKRGEMSKVKALPPKKLLLKVVAL